MSEQDKYTTIKTYVDEDVASYLSQIARGAGVTPGQAAAVLLAWSYQSTPFPAPGEEQDPDTTQASTEQAGDEARPEGEADAPTPGRSDREAEAEGVTRTPQEKMANAGLHVPVLQTLLAQSLLSDEEEAAIRAAIAALSEHGGGGEAVAIAAGKLRLVGRRMDSLCWNIASAFNAGTAGRLAFPKEYRDAAVECYTAWREAEKAYEAAQRGTTPPTPTNGGEAAIPLAEKWLSDRDMEATQEWRDGWNTCAQYFGGKYTTPPPASAATYATPDDVSLTMGPDDIPRLLIAGAEVASFPKGSWAEVCEAFDFGGYRYESPAPAAEQARPEARGVEAPADDCTATEWLDFANGNSVQDIAAALATPNPVRAEQPEGKGEDALIALFNEVYEREWDRAADEADDRAKAIMGPADEHATRMAIRAVLAAAPAAPARTDKEQHVNAIRTLCEMGWRWKGGGWVAPSAPVGAKVGCEGEDGLLRVHKESETCDVCTPAREDGLHPDWQACTTLEELADGLAGNALAGYQAAMRKDAMACLIRAQQLAASRQGVETIKTLATGSNSVEVYGPGNHGGKLPWLVAVRDNLTDTADEYEGQTVDAALNAALAGKDGAK